MTFDLSDQMTMVVIAALGNHPYREAAPVIAEMQRQANAQQRMPGMPSMPGNGKDQPETTPAQ
jgi:hypothetical protein